MNSEGKMINNTNKDARTLKKTIIKGIDFESFSDAKKIYFCKYYWFLVILKDYFLLFLV